MGKHTGKAAAATVLLALLGLAGCGQDRREADQAQQQAAQAAAERQADEQLALYRELRGSGRYEVAARIGTDLLANYPGTAAAQAVRESIEETRTQARQKDESERLAALWTYHAVAEGEGVVRTAQIQPRGGDTRLVLRDHPEWGQSVYLLTRQRLVGCDEGCEVSIVFDGAPAEQWEATVSAPQDPPAVFVEEDQAFIDRLAASATVRFELPTGGGPRTLEYEVSGYAPERFANAKPGAQP